MVAYQSHRNTSVTVHTSTIEGVPSFLKEGQIKVGSCLHKYDRGAKFLREVYNGITYPRIIGRGVPIFGDIEPAAAALDMSRRIIKETLRDCGRTSEIA